MQREAEKHFPGCNGLGKRKVKIKLDTCRKVLGKVGSVPVLIICEEKFSEICTKGYDRY